MGFLFEPLNAGLALRNTKGNGSPFLLGVLLLMLGLSSACRCGYASYDVGTQERDSGRPHADVISSENSVIDIMSESDVRGVDTETAPDSRADINGLDVHLDAVFVDTNSADLRIVDTGIGDSALFPDAALFPDSALLPDAALFPDAALLPDAALFPDATSLQIMQLHFATTNTLCWLWDADALDPGLDSYVLWYGDNYNEVIGRYGNALPWSQNDDPNLGWRYSPFGPDLVNRTCVTDLQAQTSHFAALWVRYVDKDAELVATGNAQTSAEPATAVVFFDETLEGWQLGFESTLSGHAHSGSSALLINGTGAWINGIMGSVNCDISAVSSTSWDGGFVELYIDFDDSDVHPIYYLEIEFQDENGHKFSYAYPNYVALPSRIGWQRIQIATSAFVDSVGTPMRRSELGNTLSWMRIGTNWPAHIPTCIDDIRVRLLPE